ncbi:MAG: hypothetical protein RJA70_3401, partial [Pseudomonadota bacterium]
IAISTLVTFIERAADLLAGVDGWHWKKLLASQWMATDGTGLKVRIPNALPILPNFRRLCRAGRRCEDAKQRYKQRCD